MPIPYRADLRAFLTEFTERHRGVRLGQMFGRPAGYVGRRMFTCLMDDGLIVRLPTDVARREIRRHGKPHAPANRPGAAMPTRPLGCWVMYRPRTIVEARRLVPMLELSAQHIAERQVGAPTGDRTGKRR